MGTKKADRAAIITRMHAEGATHARIADALGVSETTIWQDCKELGLTRHRPCVDRTQLLLRWYEGMSTYAIAAEQGVHYRSIVAAVADMRLPLRRASGRASKQRDAVIESMFHDGKGDAEIAGAVGMTIKSTRLARQRLRLLRTGTRGGTQ